MAKSQTALVKQQILALLGKSRSAVMGLSEIAGHVKLPPQQVLTLLGQLKGEVECTSKATMEEGASMKWTDVDSKWRLAKMAPREAPKWPPRPGAKPLKERLQAGTLQYERLVLAGYLGSPEARDALGEKAPAEVADLATWLRGLVRWGEVALVRAALAAVDRALVTYEKAVPGDDRPGRVAKAALAWCAAPGRDAAALATGTALAAEKAIEETRIEPARTAAGAAAKLGILASAAEAKTELPRLAEMVVEIVGLASRSIPQPGSLRGVIRDELVPWALGEDKR
jgi:hypothetical protein